MTNHAFYIDDATFLITHCNRTGSLECLLQAFRSIGVGVIDIIISDDGSKVEYQEKIEQLRAVYNITPVSTPVNRGLGNNINKGQDAVTTPYTMYIQEDFVPKATFGEHFRDALDFMKEDTLLYLVRFYAYFKYPYTKTFKKGFSKMIFTAAPWFTNHLKFYNYSDHPHLRRSNFLQKFGRYPEGIKGDETEFSMALSVIKKKGKGLLYDDFTGIKDQANSETEPSTMVRSNWRQRENLATVTLRKIYLPYRFVKNSLQLAFMR